MRKQRKLTKRIHQLTEIREIMDAMENLAVLETHKVADRLERHIATSRKAGHLLISVGTKLNSRLAEDSPTLLKEPMLQRKSTSYAIPSSPT